MEYIILRADSEETRKRIAVGGLAREMSPQGPRTRHIEQISREMDEKEAAEWADDPLTLDLAESMPLRLIEPLDERTSAVAATGDSWGIAAVRADLANMKGRGVRVAVLDTGLMENWSGHAAFQGFKIDPKNFTEDALHDQNGHGTHCAGTIFGNDVDNTRIGIAPGVTPIVGKVLGHLGGTTASLKRALEWAVREQRADIVSMSLGFDYPGMIARLTRRDYPQDLATSRALEAYGANLRSLDVTLQGFERDAIANRVNRPLIIAAAGNESRIVNNRRVRIAPVLPSTAHGVISVGAIEMVAAGFAVADFSNGAPWVCAPGVGILSVDFKSQGLKMMSGTSMACPHVAGVAALWWEKMARDYPGSYEHADMVKEALRSSTLRTGLSGAGAGMVQAPVGD